MKSSRKASNVRVIKNEDEPETPEILASSILKISEGFMTLKKVGLTDRAIATLLKGMTGMNDVPVSAIYLVLANLPKLSSYYIRK
jgi:hypothetical protein